MRRRLLYGTLFFSLLVVSTASMVQPVYGYEIGFPEEAIDYESQTEISLFDEDEWEKSFGKKGSDPSDIYEGDADVVGARQMEILRDLGDVDKTEGPGDHEFDELEMVENIWAHGADPAAAVDIISLTIAGLAATAPIPGPIPTIGIGMGVKTQNQTDLETLATTGVKNGSQLLNLYKESWEGGILWRDKWYFDEDWETDADWGKKNPDLEDTINYIVDHNYCVSIIIEHDYDGPKKEVN